MDYFTAHLLCRAMINPPVLHFREWAIVNLAPQPSSLTGISCGVHAYCMRKVLHHSCIFRHHSEVELWIALNHCPDFPSLFNIFASYGGFCAMIVPKHSDTAASLASSTALCSASITFLWFICLNLLRLINIEEMRNVHTSHVQRLTSAA